MVRARRLDALEADTIPAWRAAWERSAETFEKHMSGVNVAPAEVYRQLAVEQPHLSDDDVERKGRAFLESIGVLNFAAFATWFGNYEIPDLDADRPDLSMWPSDVPKPPVEVPGEWDRVLPYTASDVLIQRLTAEIYIFILAAARTAREGRASAIAR